jgi:molybdopterin synthase catalytic subunit
MIDSWLKEVKEKADPDSLGMVLVHNGVVRGTSKSGKPVQGMKLSFDRQKLEACVNQQKQKEGISDIRAWINEGELPVGADIMYLLVAGRLRTDVLPVFEELLSTVKRDIVRELEMDEPPR